MKIKVCGITNIEDAQKVVYYGAYAIGFIFYKKSPRYVSPSKVRKIIEAIGPFVTPVGVFVDAKENAIKDICRFTHIRTIQLHGDETPTLCTRFPGCKVIKAFRVNEEFDLKAVKKYKADAYLFDSYSEEAKGGTGRSFSWEIIKTAKFDRPVILSGGLNADNVEEGIKYLNPYAVDVSSGLEKSPGIKEPKKIRAFFGAVNAIDK